MNLSTRALAILGSVIMLTGAASAGANIPVETNSIQTYPLAFYHIKTSERHYNTAQRNTPKQQGATHSSACFNYRVMPKPLSVYRNRRCATNHHAASESSEQHARFNF